MTTFGERLKALTGRLGKEDQDVAEDLGLSKSQMSHYTTGKRKVPSELLQKIIDVYGINPQFLFKEDAPLYLTHDTSHSIINESSAVYRPKPSYQYDFYPVPVAAGILSTIEGVTEMGVEKITLPDSIMGNYAGSDDMFFMRVNGDSMNKVIPHHSMIAVKKVNLDALNNNDIVVYSNDYQYSVKRYYNDGNNKRLIFRAESTDSSFADQTYSYEESDNLIIHGKVVLYIVSPD